MHKPVLTREVMDFLHVNNQGRYIDATLGAGGHTLAILKAGGKVLGIEADAKMTTIASNNLGKRAEIVQGNFRDIDRIAQNSGFIPVSGIIFDLGISSVHLDQDTRGFSFKNPKMPLDMRLDSASQSVTAADLLNNLREDQLKEMFEEILGFSEAKSLAKKIIERRKIKKFSQVGDLLEIIPRKEGATHPATKPFLAVRIAVNSELDNLEIALEKAFDLLEAKGRLVVISFHSLEDRIVKNFFKKMHEDRQAIILTAKAVVPEQQEVESNLRARSAKLRALEKI